MNLNEIKKAVNEGRPVRWASDIYHVEYWEGQKEGQKYNIRCVTNDYCTGLTWLDGVTLNGDENEFYITNNKENE